MHQRLERIDGLHPMLHEPVRELFARCEADLGRLLMVVYGWRSVAEQQLIYQKGRTLDARTGLLVVTDASLVVTRALPGTSAHNVITVKGERAAMGLDVIPLLANGDADWLVGEVFWSKLYALSWKVGLDPYGDPVGAYLKTDKGHVEEPGWHRKMAGLGCLLPVTATTSEV